MTQTATVLARGASTAGTGGLANFVVASTELLGSIVVTAVTLVFAPLALLLVLGIVVWTFWRMRRDYQKTGRYQRKGVGVAGCRQTP